MKCTKKELEAALHAPWPNTAQDYGRLDSKGRHLL